MQLLFKHSPRHGDSGLRFRIRITNLDSVNFVPVRNISILFSDFLIFHTDFLVGTKLTESRFCNRTPETQSGVSCTRRSAYFEARYYSNTSKRHATVQIFLMRHAVIQRHLMRHATVQNRLMRHAAIHIVTLSGQMVYTQKLIRLELCTGTGV
jgi:hypothetical protein